MPKPPNAQHAPNLKPWLHLLLLTLLAGWLAGCATPPPQTYLPPEQRLKPPELQPPVAQRSMPPLCEKGCSNGVSMLLKDLEATFEQWLSMLTTSKATTQPAVPTTLR